jgi:hypothetical protein
MNRPRRKDWRVTLLKKVLRIARISVKPHIRKLDAYLERNPHSGLERWFAVELAAALIEDGHTVDVGKKQPDGKRPDLKISSRLKSPEFFFLELKAGSYEQGYIWQIKRGAVKYDYPEFMGCMFLGRFKEPKEQLRELLEERLKYRVSMTEAKSNSRWWIGLLRLRP